MKRDPPTGTYEILEHTADVGIHARGRSLEEAFEAAARGLVDILGVWARGPGDVRRVRPEAGDAGALLVDFLNELLFLHETEGAAFVSVRVLSATETEAEAEVEVVPLQEATEGTVVKAATYHQLRVQRAPDGETDVRVFLDV